ncbi:MAG: C69 family dipeptidase, partial [Alistipes sp.]|nr:C69 family dipeptidase [Candidatus Minthomonas equi]
MSRKHIITLFLGILAIPAQIFACTNILISKGASKDGSVMISYAADSHTLFGEVYFHPAADWKAGTMLDITEWDTGKFLGKISQIPHTYQTVGNMNQYGVMITETTYGGRHELYDSTAVMDYGSLIYVTLQRARTAREAIGIITDLVKEYGYASEGESLSIGDENEAWILEIIGKGVKLDASGNNTRKGAVWVAARVPDGYICAHANQSRIHRINFNDPENWLYSPDVVSFAREMGYFSGSDEEFSFCDAYAPIDFGGMRGCEARVWSAYRKLGGGLIAGRPADDYLDFAMGYNAANKMPLFIKPAEKVSLKDVADMMRDHYEGTPMDMTTDAGAGGHHTPYRWRPMYFEANGREYLNERAIATQQTGFWIVCQSRGWVPEELKGILWFGTDDAATSCLTPIYT